MNFYLTILSNLALAIWRVESFKLKVKCFFLTCFALYSLKAWSLSFQVKLISVGSPLKLGYLWTQKRKRKSVNKQQEQI